MGAIRLQGVTKQYGGQVVLADVDLELHEGETAALIGPNGVGKTTLFRLIAGFEQPDLGTVTRARGLGVGYLPQEPDLEQGVTLRDAVAAAFADLMTMETRLHDLSHRIGAEHDAPHIAELMADYDRLHTRFEAAGGYAFEQRLAEVLGGLGFMTADCDLPVSVLSGGQKCRAALARLLLQDRDFLLLDEPTNHLDIDAVRWLERFLASHHGGAVIISHDRYLLDRVAHKTIELMPAAGGARVTTYTGNYSAYVKARDVRRLTQARQFEQDQAFIAKEREYIARFKAGQRARQAQGRLKRLERRMDEGDFVTERPGEQHTTRFDFDVLGRTSGSAASAASAAEAARGHRCIFRTEGLRKAYGDKVLFTDLDLEVWTGQRLGITGPNGTGKSTLLKALLGLLTPDAGEVECSAAVRIGYFAQDSMELDPQRTIVEEILAVRGDLLERDARNVAARFLFTGEYPFKRVGNLSGGEQSRVRFMKLMLAAPDVLVLDEPTNHLDIASRENLEAALREFEGTVVAISHDRYFLDQIAQRLLVMRPTGHQLYRGNYTYYLEQVEQEERGTGSGERGTGSGEQGAGNGERGTGSRERGAAKGDRGGDRAGQNAQRQSSRQPGARGSQSPSGSAGPGQRRAKPPKNQWQKMKLADLEVYIHEREARVAEFNVRFGDPDLYKDAAKLAALQAEFDALKTELAGAEAAWLEKAEEGA